MTRNHDGAVTVTVRVLLGAGIAGANAKLHELGIRAKVLPQVSVGCRDRPPIAGQGAPAPRGNFTDGHWTINPRKVPAGQVLALTPPPGSGGNSSNRGNTGNGGNSGTATRGGRQFHSGQLAADELVPVSGVGLTAVPALSKLAGDADRVIGLVTAPDPGFRRTLACAFAVASQRVAGRPAVRRRPPRRRRVHGEVAVRSQRDRLDRPGR